MHVEVGLALIDGLPEELLTSVLGGHVSAWAAGRILVPLARANKEHAEKLTKHLADNPLSTRNLSEFFGHYQRSDKRTRERMIGAPSLFVKAIERGEEKRSVHALKYGPEGAWIEDLSAVRKILRRVLRHLPTVMYEGQDEQDRRSLTRAFDDAASLVEEIKEKIRKVTGP